MEAARTDGHAQWQQSAPSMARRSERRCTERGAVQRAPRSSERPTCARAFGLRARTSCTMKKQMAEPSKVAAVRAVMIGPRCGCFSLRKRMEKKTPGPAAPSKKKLVYLRNRSAEAQLRKGGSEAVHEG